MDERVRKVYDSEIKKDLREVEFEKQRFINEVKNGLGKKINDFETYVKKEPNYFQKLKIKFKKIMNAI